MTKKENIAPSIYFESKYNNFELSNDSIQGYWYTKNNLPDLFIVNIIYGKLYKLYFCIFQLIKNKRLKKILMYLDKF